MRTSQAVADNELSRDLRQAMRSLCRSFPEDYWARLNKERAYPEEFVKAMTDARYLAALIPQEYGGLGLSLIDASIILEEVNRSGGNAQPAHAQMYVMGALLRHGSEAQKRELLPRIARGELRLQAFGVTEPVAGSDTTAITTTALPRDGAYVVNGRKIFISRVQHSDLLLLLARTTPIEQVRRKTEGISMFLVNLHEAVGRGLTVKPTR